MWVAEKGLYVHHIWDKQNSMECTLVCFFDSHAATSNFCFSLNYHCTVLGDFDYKIPKCVGDVQVWGAFRLTWAIKGGLPCVIMDYSLLQITG